MYELIELVKEYGEKNLLKRTLSSVVLLWRDKHTPHVGLAVDHVDGSIFHRFLSFKPIVRAVQPLHEKGPDGDAVTDDHQLVDALLVVVPVKGAECLMHADRDIEPAFSHRHPGPELSLEFDLLVVVRGFVREHLGKLCFRNTIEQTELLLDEIDVFATIEIEFVAIALVGCRRHRLDTADYFVGRLPRSCIGRNPEPGFRLRRVVIEEVPAEPFARSVGLLPS